MWRSCAALRKSYLWSSNAWSFVLPGKIKPGSCDPIVLHSLWKCALYCSIRWGWTGADAAYSTIPNTSALDCVTSFWSCLHCCLHHFLPNAPNGTPSQSSLYFVKMDFQVFFHLVQVHWGLFSKWTWLLLVIWNQKSVHLFYPWISRIVYRPIFFYLIVSNSFGHNSALLWVVFLATQVFTSFSKQRHKCVRADKMLVY